MAIIKCKMCGGDLPLTEGMTVCECEYCGTKQTVPTADNEKKLTLFARANRLRAANEFDKAAGVYESIVAEFPEEAEAYWGLVLCRYGIEYVDDPATGRKIPTCHRSSFDSVLKDTDFEQACENADAIARRQYREEAKQIEDIRRGIIDVSGKEEPYDIFICYKETDDNGERTIDSVLAQDVYDALTDKGYRVFFSHVSLEDKLGTEYEPYIFAALNSAKIMLAFGTDYEYYNAVWVKNEWSRFLKLMAKDKSKHLIPCYKNLDPYDIPDEFQRLQAQDLGKVGAVQDLLRGIEKILGGGKSETPPAPQSFVEQSAGGVNLTAQIKRGIQALEDGDWSAADGFFDKALDIDAECAEAFFGKALAAAKCATGDALVEQRLAIRGTGTASYEACRKDTEKKRAAVQAYEVPGYLSTAQIESYFNYDERKYTSQTESKVKRLTEEKDYWEKNRHLNRAVRYASGDIAATLQSLRERINDVLTRDLAQSREKDAQEKERVATQYAERLVQAEQTAKKQYEQALEKREADYIRYCQAQEKADSAYSYSVAADSFEQKEMRNYKDSADRAAQCREEAVRLREVEQRERLEADYVRNCELQAKADQVYLYLSAAEHFERKGMRDYKDSAERAKQCREEATRLSEEAKKEMLEADYVDYCKKQESADSSACFSAVAILFGRESMRDYKDSAERARQCQAEAVRLKKEECLQAERATLQTELNNLRGLFTGKRRKEINARMAEIEEELKRL